jgi:hypothetical protein
MSILNTSHTEGDTLFVQASGRDDSLEEVLAYAGRVIDAAVRSGATRILCDETAIEYRLDTMDTFEAGRYISEQAPKVAKIAIVCNPAFIQDAQFFENVTVNRGLTLKVFTDTESAKQWLGQTAG